MTPLITIACLPLSQPAASFLRPQSKPQRLELVSVVLLTVHADENKSI